MTPSQAGQLLGLGPHSGELHLYVGLMDDPATGVTASSTGVAAFSTGVTAISVYIVPITQA